MSVHRLGNDRWSFASSCFVCEPSNEFGLRVPFSNDDEADRVFATFTLDEHCSGAPSYVHGGVTLALLDETMSWAMCGTWDRMNSRLAPVSRARLTLPS